MSDGNNFIPLKNPIFSGQRQTNEGIYLPPSAFESYFLNDALSFEDIEKTILSGSVDIESVGILVMEIINLLLPFEGI